MKAILMPIRPERVAKILNGEKTVEFRKGVSLKKAVEKLIAQYGEATIYFYCAKGKQFCFHDVFADKGGCKPFYYLDDKEHDSWSEKLNGKVVAKFTCKKVEGIQVDESIYSENTRMVVDNSCLTLGELRSYAGGSHPYYGTVYAYHISGLEIFDKPKELSEFMHYKRFDCYNADFDYTVVEYRKIELTKAPKSWCYVE